MINEWLWADSAGDNGLEAQAQVVKVMEGLVASDHRLVIIEGSPFEQKAWALCKSKDRVVVGLAKTWALSIRQNLDRCILIRPNAATPLPDELAQSINPDDHYLVQAQLSVAGVVLVTTDLPLRQRVLEVGLACRSRDEFLADLGL